MFSSSQSSNHIHKWLLSCARKIKSMCITGGWAISRTPSGRRLAGSSVTSSINLSKLRSLPNNQPRKPEEMPNSRRRKRFTRLSSWPTSMSSSKTTITWLARRSPFLTLLRTARSKPWSRWLISQYQHTSQTCQGGMTRWVRCLKFKRSTNSSWRSLRRITSTFEYTVHLHCII